MKDSREDGMGEAARREREKERQILAGGRREIESRWLWMAAIRDSL